MMKTEMNWICDTMNNDVKNAFGKTYNGEFVIGPDGVLLKKRFWSDPVELRKDLVTIIGPVKKETTVADLETVFTPKPRKIASNVVPKPVFPRGLRTMKITPKKSDEPFFAKLRIESSQDFYQGIQGPIFFTVYLDPIHEVHWNNRAGKIKLDIISNDEEFKFKKQSLESLDVKEDADVDPRWLIVNGQRLQNKPFQVKLSYTICDDAETFCKSVEQVYRVEPIVDPNAGTRPGIFLNGLFSRVKELDKNDDKRLTVDELPQGKVTLYVGHLDYNADGLIDFKEIDRFMNMFNNGNGPDLLDDGQFP